jgi:hypothetical protein
VVAVGVARFLKRKARHHLNRKAFRNESEVSLAFLGNSMLYYNDMPRFVAYLLEQIVQQDAVGSFLSSACSCILGETHGRANNPTRIRQNSCMRGGATLTTLWERGNGMRRTFVSSKDIGAPTVKHLFSSRRRWNFVVMNDHTTSAARPETHQVTIETLIKKYQPLLFERNANAVPILVMTPAHRCPIQNSSIDLGTVEEFTARVEEGYRAYAIAWNQHSRIRQETASAARIAPVGLAFLHVHKDRPELWIKLYQDDDLHPSLCGSWLMALVIIGTILGGHLPEPTSLVTRERALYDIDAFWREAKVRTRQDPNISHSKPCFAPSREEALYLWQVAQDTLDQTSEWNGTFSTHSPPPSNIDISQEPTLPLPDHSSESHATNPAQ